MKKDKDMQEYRQANGIPEPVWPPTGEGGLHSFADTTEKPTKPTTSESPEMALDAVQSLGGYRLLCSLDEILLRNLYAELQSDEDTSPRGLCNTCLPPGLWPRLQDCEVKKEKMGLKYPRTKEKKKSCFGEPCRHPHVGEWKKKSCLGRPCRHPQVGEKDEKRSGLGEPCRHPQGVRIGEPCRHPQAKKKAVDLMSLDKISQPNQKEVNAIDKNHKIKFTVDAGAAEIVCEKSDAKEFPTIYGGSESLTKYIMPNGEIVENDGEKHLKVKTAEGEKFIVRTQLTDVRKPLMSVSKVCDEGNIVVFKQNGGCIQNEKTGKKTSFSREGNVYALDMDLVSDFTGPAK
jgi:hypothetical protein